MIAGHGQTVLLTVKAVHQIEEDLGFKVRLLQLVGILFLAGCVRKVMNPLCAVTVSRSEFADLPLRSARLPLPHPPHALDPFRVRMVLGFARELAGDLKQLRDARKPRAPQQGAVEQLLALIRLRIPLP